MASLSSSTAERCWTGASPWTLASSAREQWTLVLSNNVLTEYQEVLHREQRALPYTDEEIERLLDGLCLGAEKKRLRSRWWPVLSDPDDEMMVHLAVEGRVEYVVTHNVRHLQPAGRFGVSVVTPAEFLRELRKKV